VNGKNGYPVIYCIYIFTHYIPDWWPHYPK